MSALRRLLSVVLILVLVTGTTAQAAPMMPMEGMAGGMAASAGMEMKLGVTLDCPDCGGMEQGTAEMAVCRSICIKAAMLLPEAPRPALPAASLPTPARPTLGRGQAPQPEPFPPRFTLRI